MPPLPDVTKVIRLAMKQTVATDMDVLTITHWQYTGDAPASADLSTFCSDIATLWESAKVIYGEETYLVGIEAVDLTTTSAGLGTWSGSVVGTNGAGNIAAGTAFLVNYQIGTRYRGGKPRSYLPVGGSSDLTTERQWSSDFVTAVTAAWGDFLAGISALTPGPVTGLTQCAVSYYGPPNYTKGVLPNPVKTYSTLRDVPLVYDIVGASYSSIPSSQRRRNGQKRQRPLDQVEALPVYGPPTVYTELLGSFVDSGTGAFGSFPVPAGYKWIIREVIWFQPAPGIEVNAVGTLFSSATGNILDSFNLPPGTNSNFVNNGPRFCVVQAEDVLGCDDITVAGTQIYITGTQLLLPT